MLTLDALRGLGVKVDEGLARCMGNEQLYLRLVNTVLDDPSFGRLSEALDRKDYKTAFESAHALKGVLGNLSLTPLYDVIAGLTEDLRSQKEGDYSKQLQQVLEGKRRLEALRTG